MYHFSKIKQKPKPRIQIGSLPQILQTFNQKFFSGNGSIVYKRALKMFIY